MSISDMLDDLTLFSSSDTSDLGNTLILGANYQGKKIEQFTLNGQVIMQVPVPEQVLD